MSSEEDLQRGYDAERARGYDATHLHEGDEHYFGLAVLAGALEQLRATSLLEVGAGTGRGLRYLAQHAP